MYTVFYTADSIRNGIFNHTRYATVIPSPLISASKNASATIFGNVNAPTTSAIKSTILPTKLLIVYVVDFNDFFGDDLRCFI